MILTYKYRIKDACSRQKLCKLAGKINFTWNYVNEIVKKRYRSYHQGIDSGFFSEFDVNDLLAGTAKILKLHACTIQSICSQYFVSKNKAKKSYLTWRNRRRGSLGWIPFKSKNIRLTEDSISFMKKRYRFYKDRSLPTNAIIKSGCFHQDSRNRWFVNIVFEVGDIPQHPHPNRKVGIDLGVKDCITLSDNKKYPRLGLTKKYEDKLAYHQRKGNKKQVTKLHDKIKNVRNDFIHKITTEITKKYGIVVVGDLQVQQIIDKSVDSNKKNLTKATYDAALGKIKTLLEYKAGKLGGVYRVVDEAYTTQDCSRCNTRCGPKGDEGLNVRTWNCVSCHATHDRDINSAKNILKKGMSNRP